MLSLFLESLTIGFRRRLLSTGVGLVFLAAVEEVVTLHAQRQQKKHHRQHNDKQELDVAWPG